MISFAWIKPKSRFIMEKQCWFLHPGEIDRVVASYGEYACHEANGRGVGGRFYREFFDLLDRIASDVPETPSNCHVNPASDRNSNTPPVHFHHAGHDAGDRCGSQRLGTGAHRGSGCRGFIRRTSEVPSGCQRSRAHRVPARSVRSGRSGLGAGPRQSPEIAP